MDDQIPVLPGTLPIPDRPEYRVGRDGSIWRLVGSGTRSRPYRWKRLKPQWIGGQLHIVVGPRGQRKTYRVATLVLRLFVESRPLGFRPLHFPDPDPANCRADNLRWAPTGASWAGEQASTPNLPKHDPGSTHHNARLTPTQVGEARKLYREGWTSTDLAAEFQCSQGTILNLLKGRTYTDVPDPLGPIVLRSRGREGGFNGTAKLTDDEREQIWIWHEVEGVSYPEIGRRLEINPSTAWQVVQKRKVTNARETTDLRHHADPDPTDRR